MLFPDIILLHSLIKHHPSLEFRSGCSSPNTHKGPPHTPGTAASSVPEEMVQHNESKVNVSATG